jgi:hypothetical protein
MNFAKLSALIIGIGLVSVPVSGTHSSSVSTEYRAVPTEQEQARMYEQNELLYNAVYKDGLPKECRTFRKVLVVLSQGEEKISVVIVIIEKKDGSFDTKLFIKKEDDEFIKNIRQNGSVEELEELEKQIERPIYEVLSASDPVTTSGKVHKLLRDSEENNLETLNTMVEEVGSDSETRKHVQVVNTRITS